MCFPKDPEQPLQPQPSVTDEQPLLQVFSHTSSIPGSPGVCLVRVQVPSEKRLSVTLAFPWLPATAVLKHFWSVTRQEGIYFSSKSCSIAVLAASGEWPFTYICVLGCLRNFFCLFVFLAGLHILCCCCGNPYDSCLAQSDKFIIARVCWSAHCVCCTARGWYQGSPSCRYWAVSKCQDPEGAMRGRTTQGSCLCGLWEVERTWEHLLGLYFLKLLQE